MPICSQKEPKISRSVVGVGARGSPPSADSSHRGITVPSVDRLVPCRRRLSCLFISGSVPATGRNSDNNLSIFSRRWRYTRLRPIALPDCSKDKVLWGCVRHKTVHDTQLLIYLVSV